jgi:TP901 family phage tail tape measure protein
MADDIRSDIIINVDTSVGIAEIKNLQRQISQLNAQLLKSGAQQAASAQNIQRNLINNINATGQFAASVKTISTTAESFTSSLEKNKLSMGEYFKYAGASTKTFGRLFRSEFDTIEKVARERVKTLQTQYVKLGRDGSGAMKAIAVRPLSLDMNNLATRTALAAQKQQLFNQLLKQGSTNLLNFGKNTQWAGRQLMVGFTIPLAIFGSMAVKEFQKIEKQAIRFKRVYGDAFDLGDATDKALDEMKRLADGFTRYGVEVEKTLALAADAAQMGLKGAALTAQVTEATRLAVLGEVEQQEALKTTISVTNAFGVAAKDLAGKIDFLNAVENETVTAISDLTIAIPKAGPVVRQLGGDVEDLAFFLTAMKEGGINASEGANALKSGLAKLINPTKTASDFLQGFGINITGIVEANKGDVKGIVLDFAKALDNLDPLNRARAIEKLFGKFQFSRISTLFQNVIKDGSQAQKVLKLATATSAELAIISERELKRVEESPLFKFQKQLEKFQAALAPIGEEFLKAITPIVTFGAELLKKFNEMGDGAKQFVVIATTLVGGIGPIFLMMFGLIANGAANIIKLFGNLMAVFSKVGNSSRNLGISTDYMTQEQLEATAVASSLNQSHAKLIQTFAIEAGAVDRLAASYGRAIVQQSRFLGRNPQTGGPAPKKFARGVLSVPGPKGAGDIVPAMLSPGEAVIPAKQASKYRGLVSSMISDNIPGYRFGLNPFASMLGRSKVATRMDSGNFINALRASGKDAKYQSAFSTQSGADYLTKYGILNPRQKQARSNMERDLFGLDPRSTPNSARPTYGYAKTSVLQSLVNRIFGLKGKNFNSLTANLSEKSLSRYGNIDLITKSSVAKRSTAYPNDTLMEYVRAKESGASLGTIQRYQKASPMRGATPQQLKSFKRLGMPFGNNLVAGTKNQYSVNPKSPYVETQTPGGFSFKEIDKIIARDPAIAKQLKQELRAAGLGRVRVAGSGFISRLFKGMGVPGYRVGTEKVARSRNPKVFSNMSSATKDMVSLDFDRSSTLDSAHMSASPSASMTKKQAQNFFEKELQKGIRSGAFSRMGLDPNAIRSDFNNKLGRLSKNSDVFKLFSNMVEPLPSMANRVTANIKSEALSAKDYLKGIARMPRGLFGSGILSRLPEGHGIPDRQIKSYAMNIEKAIKTELKAVASKEKALKAQDPNAKLPVKETDFQKMYKKAEEKAIKKIKDPVTRRLIQDANYLGRLATTPSTPGAPGTGSGRTGKVSAIFGDVQDKLISARRSSTFGRIFGANSVNKLEKNFLSQTKLMLPKDLRDGVRDYIKTLPKKEAFRFANELINSIHKTGKPRLPENLKNSAERYASAERVLKEHKTGKKTKAGPKKATQPESSVKSKAKKPATAVKVAKPQKPAKQVFSLASILRSGRGLRLNNGIVSVPGPKGAGDVVPAMLSPGEAVIPAQMSKKYAPLINSMIAGSIPGYEDGLAAAGLTRGPKGGHYDARTGAYVKPRDAQARISAVRASNKPGGRAIGTAGTVAGMAAMAYGMSGGPGADIAGQIGFPLMMLGMLKNPVALAVLAIGGLAAGIYLLNSALETARKKGVETAKAMTMTGDKLQAMSEFMGTVSATEISKRSRQDMISGTSGGQRKFGQSYLESETGSTMMADIETMASSGMSSGDISKNLSRQLGYAIVQGVITQDQAQSIAAALGEKLGDYSISASISGNLVSLFGKNGENLLDSPLQISLQIQEESMSDVESKFGLQQIAVLKNSQNDFLNAGQAITAGAAAGIAATSAGLAIAAGGMAAIPVAGWIAGGLTLIAAGVLGAKAISTELAEAKENAEITGASLTVASEQLAQNRGLLDSIKQQYDQKIAIKEQEIAATTNVEKRKDLEEELNELYDKRKTDVEAIRQSNATSFDNIMKQSLAMDKRTFDDGFKSAAAGVYTEGTDKIFGDQAIKAIDEMDGKQGYTREFQATLSLAYLSKELDPQVITSLIDANEKTGGKISTEFSTLVKAKGTGEANDLLQLLSTSNISQANYPVYLQMFAQKDRDFDESFEAMSALTTFSSAYGFTIDLNVNGQEKIDAIKDYMDKTKDFPETIDLKYITEMADTTKDPVLGAQLRSMIANWDVISGGDNEAAYQVTVDFLVGKSDPGVLAAYMAERGISSTGIPWVDEGLYGAAAAASRVGEREGDTGKKGGDGEGDGTKGGAGTDPFAEPLKRLKEVRAAAVDAKGGVTELAKWLGGNKNMKQFQGLEQRLMKRGVNRTFIDYVLGLDKDVQQRFVTFKDGILKIKAAGKNLAKAFNEIALGEFQISLKQASEEAENQSKAFNKLVGAGMSVAEALEAIEDPALAAAIASKSISSEELKKLGKDANDAAAKIGLVAAKLQLVRDIQQAAGELAMRKAFDTNSVKLTELQQAAIEFDSTLSGIYQEFLTGITKELPAEFATRMQQVIDNIEFKKSVFQAGFGKAMEAFSAQEEKLQIEMELNLKEFSIPGVAEQGAREILSAAQNEIAALQFSMDDLQAGIQEIEWQEDAVNEKYDKRLDALDKIEKANEAISAQQKTQISLADALSQGDIAAAAAAAQEMRSQSAQSSIGSQRELIESARQGELGSLTSSTGMTRKQLEAAILNIQKEIFRIEEDRLELAAEAIRKAEAQLARNTESLTVLGKTSFEWAQINNNINLAVTSSRPFIDAMQAALDIVKSIVDYWNQIGTRKLVVGNPLDPYGILDNSRTARANRQYFENTVLPAIASGTASNSQAIDYANAVNQALGRPQGTAVAMSGGGSVRMPKREPAPVQRMSNGGSIFQPNGTDTIPAMLTPGEYVIKASSVDKFGESFLDSINAGALPGFNKGGKVKNSKSQKELADIFASQKTPKRSTSNPDRDRLLAVAQFFKDYIFDPTNPVDYALAGIPFGKPASLALKGTQAVSKIAKSPKSTTGKKQNSLKNFIDFKRNPKPNVLSDRVDIATMDGYVANAGWTMFPSFSANRSQIDSIIRSNRFGIPKGYPLARIANEADAEILKYLKPGQAVTLDRFMSVTNASSKEFLEGMAKGTVQTGGRGGGIGKAPYPMYKFNVKTDIPGIEDINKILPERASNVVDGLLARGQNMKLVKITTDRKTGQQIYHFDIGKGIKAKTGFQQLGGKQYNEKMRQGLISEGMGHKFTPSTPGLGGFQNQSEWMPRYFANGGMAKPSYFSSGGMVPKYMPMGGLVPYMNMGGSVKVPRREPPPAQKMNMGGLFKPRGTDTVPAMLTPGEFVMKKYAVDTFGLDRMKAINNGTYDSDSVYNYSVNVSVKTDANADQIARAVIGQIKQIDSQRIRGNKF